MAKRISHNLAKNKIRQRPISLTSVAASFGLASRPLSLAQLAGRLVSPPLAPRVKVEFQKGEGLANTHIDYEDAGKGTNKESDAARWQILRGNSVLNSDDGNPIGMSIEFDAEFDVQYLFEITVSNDAGVASTQSTILWRSAPSPPLQSTHPTISFDREQSKLIGSGFKPGDVVFIRVQIRGPAGIRDSSQLPTGLPSTTADSQGRIDTPLDIKAAVPEVIVDNTTDPLITLAGCAVGETVVIQAHDSRRDPQSPSNDFLWSNAFRFTC
jgi:hypothetical protein